MTGYSAEELARPRRRLPLRWQITVVPRAEELDDRGDALDIHLVDDDGPIAVLALPDALTAMTRPTRSGVAEWRTGVYLDHPCSVLVQTDADMREGEALCALLAGTRYAWCVLAGRTLPPLEHGPIALEFPVLPEDLAILAPEAS